jgi:16S rRNA processing protein RimM
VTDLLLVGRVARAHGNRGQVIVNLETDFAEERFAVGRTLRIEQNGRASERRIASVRFHQGRPVVGFDGVETMDDAEALAGAELKIAESEAAPLADGTFYHHDLIGCEVRDVADRKIGTVVRVDGPMERSILAVDAPRGEVLIPLVADITVTVNPAAKLVVVNPPEGLIDLNTTRRQDRAESEGRSASEERPE